MQRQAAVTAYLKSNQLLLFDFIISVLISVAPTMIMQLETPVNIIVVHAPVTLYDWMTLFYGIEYESLLLNMFNNMWRKLRKDIIIQQTWIHE